MSEKGHLARFTFDAIIGNSDLIKKTKSLAKKFALVDGTVLIQGGERHGKRGVCPEHTLGKQPF